MIRKDSLYLLDESNKLTILYGIALGMSYLHSHNIIHRDLKTENIYIDENYYPKITGFTISKEIGANSKVKSKKIKGTPIYLAPEIILNMEYSKSSDVYAFSFIVYELMTCQKPFNEMISPSEIKQKVAIEGFRPKLKKNFPQIYRKLIERCWSTCPEERPTFDEIAYELRENPDFIISSDEWDSEGDNSDEEDEEEEFKSEEEKETKSENSEEEKEIKSENLDEELNSEEEIKSEEDNLEEEKELKSEEEKESILEEEELKSEEEKISEKEDLEESKSEIEKNVNSRSEKEKDSKLNKNQNEDDIDYYQKYLKYIDKSEISFNPTKKIKAIDNFISSNFSPAFLKSHNKINI